MCNVYSLEFCPNCDELKSALTEHGIVYKEKSLNDIDVVTDLLFDGISVSEAPILYHKDKYFQPADLFSNGYLNLNIII
jgi:glutaredoxin